MDTSHITLERLAYLSLGLILGMAGVSQTDAATPKRIADDVAIYQNLREVRIRRTRPVNFDKDLKRLAGMEYRYQEKLPGLASHKRLRKPFKRVTGRKYRTYKYKGKRKRVVRKKRRGETSRIFLYRRRSRS